MDKDFLREQKMKRQTVDYFIIFILFFLVFFGCKKKLPVEDDISGSHFTLLNEDSVQVSFPGYLKGQITVMGFIFTNCPDICPLTTNNMQRLQKKLQEENIAGVSFVSLSFDPKRDRPWVMKQFAEVRGIDFKEWHFLTGEQSVIDSIKRKMHFFAIAADTSYSEEGTPYYFFVHTDRISLIDREGKVRKNYKGSTVNLDEIMQDIKSLM